MKQKRPWWKLAQQIFYVVEKQVEHLSHCNMKWKMSFLSMIVYWIGSFLNSVLFLHIVKEKMRNLFETCWCIKIDRFLLKPQFPENITFFKHMWISRDFSEQKHLQLGTAYQDWHIKLFWPFTVWINCSSALKIFAYKYASQAIPLFIWRIKLIFWFSMDC